MVAELNVQRARGGALEQGELLLKMKLESKLRKAFNMTAAHYAQFWDVLQDRSPAHERFLAQGRAATEGTRKVKSLWMKLSSLRCGLSSRMAYLHYMFVKNVMNSHEQTEDLPQISSDEAGRLSQFAEPDEPVIGVSALQKSLGKILRVNQAFCQLSGYPPDGLQGADVETLIPPMFRGFHNAGFAARCYECNGISKVAHSGHDIFVLHSSGYIVPCELQIVEAPSVLSLYCFMARIKPKVEKSQHGLIHILTDAQGAIQHSSSSIALCFRNS